MFGVTGDDVRVGDGGIIICSDVVLGGNPARVIKQLD